MWDRKAERIEKYLKKRERAKSKEQRKFNKEIKQKRNKDANK